MTTNNKYFVLLSSWLNYLLSDDLNGSSIFWAYECLFLPIQIDYYSKCVQWLTLKPDLIFEMWREKEKISAKCLCQRVPFNICCSFVFRSFVHKRSHKNVDCKLSHFCVNLKYISSFSLLPNGLILNIHGRIQQTNYKLPYLKWKFAFAVQKKELIFWPVDSVSKFGFSLKLCLLIEKIEILWLEKF